MKPEIDLMVYVFTRQIIGSNRQTKFLNLLKLA